MMAGSRYRKWKYWLRSAASENIYYNKIHFLSINFWQLDLFGGDIFVECHADDEEAFSSQI